MIISIYQLKDDYSEFYKSSYTSITNTLGHKPTRNMYKKVYTGEVEDGNDIEDIFRILQREMPDDYLGTTFGVSDVIGIDKGGNKLKTNDYYFCNNIGWEKIDWSTERKEERLAENYDDNNLFFCTAEQFDIKHRMRKAEEGNHFFLTIGDAKDGLSQLGYKYIYSISSFDLNRPLYIDGDIVLWDAENFAELFRCKIDDKPYDVWQDGTEIIYPEDIHIENLTLKDKKEIDNFKDIDDVFDFVRRKGFDHIRYKNRYEKEADSIILNHDSHFDWSTLELEYEKI